MTATLPYNCQDTDITFRLHDRYMTEERLLSIPNIHELLQLQSDLEPIADEMTWRGIRVDRTRQAYHHHQLRTRQRKAEIAFYEYTQQRPAFKGRIWTETDGLAPNGLRQYFYEHLGETPFYFSDKTGEPSLHELALAELMKSSSPRVRESARLLYKAKKWKYLDSQFIVKLQMDEHNVVHPFHHPAGALSGRWTCRKPNLLNIPNPQQETQVTPGGKVKRVTIHGGLRDIFVPMDPNGWIVGGDYSQIELRLGGYHANEDSLTDAFEAGLDVHNLTAQDLWYKGDRDAEVSNRERTCIKIIQYTIWYGGDEHTLYDGISAIFPDFTLSAAKEFLDRYLAMRPKIVDFQQRMFKIASQNFCLTDPISGRSRYWWNTPPKPETINLWPQAGAAHVFNQAIKRIFPRLRWPVEGITLGLHDAFYFDGPDPIRLATILTEEMPTSVEINGRTCELPIDLAVGRNLGYMVKVKKLSDMPAAMKCVDKHAPKSKQCSFCGKDEPEKKISPKKLTL